MTLSRFLIISLYLLSLFSLVSPSWGASGLEVKTWREKTAAGPMMYYMAKVDPRRFELKTVLAKRNNSGGFGRATSSAICKATKALIGINGSFFSYHTNLPTGLIMQNGDLVSSSPMNRSVFALREDGTCFVDDAQVNAGLTCTDGEEIVIERMNREPPKDGLAIFTPHIGRSTKTSVANARFEVAVDQNNMAITSANGNLPVPLGGYVISAAGKAADKLATHLPLGSYANIYTRLPETWQGVTQAIGGGPTLVKNGLVHVTAQAEKFSAAIAKGRAPRTAIGVDSKGAVMLVVVDGRHPGVSVGATLYELARVLVRLGAVDAINLDGGGSSTFVYGTRVLNRPSGGRERLVGNIIGVYNK
jgi:exopolysaccharide biosynthesis protein